MSNLPPTDPRVDQAAVTDESLLAAHEKLLGKQPDEKGRYRLQPLLLLFFGSALVMFCGTYIGRHAGRFHPTVFNENASPQAPGAATAAAAPVDPVALGKKLFNDGACNTCHQATGAGLPGAIPPLVESEWVSGSEERAIRIVLYGLTGPITVKGTNYNSVMPAFGKGVPASMKNWRDDQVAAVLTYIRQEWGNKAPPVTAQKVAEVHAKDGEHKPYTAAELEKLP